MLFIKLYSSCLGMGKADSKTRLDCCMSFGEKRKKYHLHINLISIDMHEEISFFYLDPENFFPQKNILLPFF